MRRLATVNARETILQRYREVRARTVAICEPLSIEDHVAQPSADVSPPRWHLAHTSWFFETFLLTRFVPHYRPVNAHYSFLFNSYYESVGDRALRNRRGQYTRPTVAEIHEYRREVDARVQQLCGDCADTKLAELQPILELGLQHEQQHQELLLTDIQAILFQAPLYPAYRADFPAPAAQPPESWRAFEGGVRRVGHTGDGFCFDNELQVHDVLLQPFALSSRFVTNAEFAAFIADGGYRKPALWLSDGFDIVQAQGLQRPLYWLEDETEFTLRGRVARVADAPVCHVSYYEADAFARWAGRRLPTEFELEVAAQAGDPLQPGPLWQWTRSAYGAYPGYRVQAGGLGEYNGKFMVNQMVLRGGSAATPPGHWRGSYRNFWHADKRWQFTGIRLARD